MLLNCSGKTSLRELGLVLRQVKFREMGRRVESVFEEEESIPRVGIVRVFRGQCKDGLVHVKEAGTRCGG